MVPFLTPLALAAADPQRPTEEITVWADRFARWQRRWYVETEISFVHTPVLYETVNHEMRVSRALFRVVLDCEVDFVLGVHSREVSCRIEDLSAQLAPVVPTEFNERIVAELDRSLTGATVQLQVRDSGKVPNIDLEGIGAKNRRERARVEQLRQMMSRVILPFHLEMEEAFRDGASWYEYNSLLFQLPTGAYRSGTATAGASTIAHFANKLGPERFVVQSIGEALVYNPSNRATLALDMHGVALVDADTGILSERVWVVSGEHTASSPFTISSRRWYHAGRLRMLDQDEQVSVGPTVVASSGKRDDPAPAWVRLEP
jgi:hypothetical protein